MIRSHVAGWTQKVLAGCMFPRRKRATCQQFGFSNKLDALGISRSPSQTSDH
jgi:hypothetical protein